MDYGDSISRQAAIKLLLERCAEEDTDLVYHGIYIAKELIKGLPSVSEIIRCKECKYACIDTDRESDEIYCSEMDFYPSDEFYCGYAERRRA